MSVVPNLCPMCGEAIESYAFWDWHKRVDHLRDDEPCERCGQWDEERTLPTQFGWMHAGCANQIATEQAKAHMDEAG